MRRISKIFPHFNANDVRSCFYQITFLYSMQNEVVHIFESPKRQKRQKNILMLTHNFNIPAPSALGLIIEINWSLLFFFFLFSLFHLITVFITKIPLCVTQSIVFQSLVQTSIVTFLITCSIFSAKSLRLFPIMVS